MQGFAQLCKCDNTRPPRPPLLFGYGLLAVRTSDQRRIRRGMLGGNNKKKKKKYIYIYIYARLSKIMLGPYPKAPTARAAVAVMPLCAGALPRAPTAASVRWVPKPQSYCDVLRMLGPYPTAPTARAAVAFMPLVDWALP